MSACSAVALNACWQNASMAAVGAVADDGVVTGAAEVPDVPAELASGLQPDRRTTIATDASDPSPRRIRAGL